MQITRPAPGALVIQNTPWMLWFFSALWAAIGAALLGAQLGVLDALPLPAVVRSALADPEVVSRDAPSIAVAFVIILSGLALIALVAATSWTFADGALTIRQARLVGARAQTYRLHELSRAELQRSTKGATRVAIVRAGGPELLLTSYYSSGGVTRKREAVAAINQMLGYAEH